MERPAPLTGIRVLDLTQVLAGPRGNVRHLAHILCDVDAVLVVDQLRR